MKTHVSIPQDRLDNLSRPETVDGVDMIVTLSPYTTPRVFWSDYSNDGQQVILGFDYSDQEPLGRKTILNGVTVTEGKYSGKLMTLAIPVKDLPDQLSEVDDVKVRALNALSQRLDGLGNKIDRILNQQVATQVIEKDLGQILMVRQIAK